MNEAPAPTTEPSAPRRVEAKAAKDPAVRLFIFAAMMLGFGAWLFYDGYVVKKYPRPEEPFADALNGYMNWAMNCIGPLILLPLGLLVLVKAVLFLKRVLVADGDGIGYAGKRKIAWADIEEADASRLKGKGILDLYYAGGRRLTLDSWKLLGFRDLVALVEQHVPAEKIGK